MMQTSRPLLDALRYAVRTLQADPEALTPQKSELLQQLRGQVEELRRRNGKLSGFSGTVENCPERPKAM